MHTPRAWILCASLLAAAPAHAGDPAQDVGWDARAAEHLLNRAGFGARPSEIEAAVALGHAAFVEQLLERRAPVEPFWIERHEPPPRRELRELEEAERRKVEREYRERDRRQLLEYTAWWFERMQSGEDPLLEKMVLFWHGHFTTSVEEVKRSYVILRQNQLVREHALGSYATLLGALARDPALLTFLDNQVNRKGNPNENFARELLELFTLGEGNYSEQDIKEVARAFTGRGVDGRGDYAFNKGQHDAGAKTILGESGKLDGDDVVRILLRQGACARHVARRLITWFEGVQPAPARLDEYARFLAANRYELQPFLRQLFLDPDFYRAEVLGARVQGPVEYMVGSARRLGLRAPPPVLAAGSMLLGQRLFAPPSVKGWDEGEAWITTSSLMQRGNLAGLVLGVVRVEDVLRVDEAEIMRADDEPVMDGGPMTEDAQRVQRALEERKQKGELAKLSKAKAGPAVDALRRVQDQGWSPAINFSVRMQRLGARTDQEIVERMLDELLAIRAPEDTRARLVDFLAHERASLGLREGSLSGGEAAAERLLRRLAHLILSLPEAQLG